MQNIFKISPFLQKEHFDEKPNLKDIDFLMENTIQDQTSETTRHALKLLPSFSSSYDISKVFTNGRLEVVAVARKIAQLTK